MAKDWTGNLPTLQSATASSGSLNVLIPDATETGPLTTIARGLTLNSDIDFTEFIEVNVTFDHPSFRDLDIDLVSPSGAVSHLTVLYDTYTPDDPPTRILCPCTVLSASGRRDTWAKTQRLVAAKSHGPHNFRDGHFLIVEYHRLWAQQCAS